MALKLFGRPKVTLESPRTAERPVAKSAPAEPVAAYDPAPVENAESDPLRAMLLQERFATLLRGRELLEQHHDSEALVDQAVARLEESIENLERLVWREFFRVANRCQLSGSRRENGIGLVSE